ncbi:MAG: DegT/DnrJ/EryC1/StrS family aminotransferase [Microthrixaceae bacterium]
MRSLFALAHGAADAVGCGSGTDALTLAMVAAGLGPGDEVVVPSMTFIATAEAVVHAGAIPVLADVDPRTLLLTEETVESVRTEKTRAVVPVHLFGHMVEPTAMRSWKDQDLVVIEDAAQAHLAHHHDVGVGTIGDAACFSFYPGKNLGALGDGGALTTDSDAIRARSARLRDHGSDQRYIHEEVGWCSRLDGVQAAVLEVKLRHLRQWTHARRQLAVRYREGLGEILVPWTEGAVHHLLAVRIPGGRRDSVATDLNRAGIETGVHYPVALSQQPALTRWKAATPVAESASKELLSLPMDPLMNSNEVDHVVEVLLSLL